MREGVRAFHVTDAGLDGLVRVLSTTSPPRLMVFNGSISLADTGRAVLVGHMIAWRPVVSIAGSVVHRRVTPIAGDGVVAPAESLRRDHLVGQPAGLYLMEHIMLCLPARYVGTATIALLFIATVSPAHAQAADDSAGIRQVAFDYIEGWYTGDGARMERAIHPELAKRIVTTNPQNKRSDLGQKGALTLVQGTRGGGGRQTPGRSARTKSPSSMCTRTRLA
jgi:hypothetical protein